MSKITLILGENEQKLYKKLGADPRKVFDILHIGITELIEETGNIYDALEKVDEADVVIALIESAEKMKLERIRRNKKARKKLDQLYEKREQDFGKIREGQV